jgi:hypothetical protein
MSDWGETNKRPGDSWRREVNWRYVRLLTVAHMMIWLFAFGLVIAAHYDLLVGAVKKTLGIIALVIFGASLVGIAPVFGQPLQKGEDGAGVWQFPVFLIVFAFLASSGGYMLVLTYLGLDSIALW